MSLDETDHPKCATWDSGSVLFATGAQAILARDSLRALSNPLQIRGATGVTSANIVGVPHHQRDALAKQTVYIKALGKYHLASMGRMTQPDSDGHSSFFLLTPYDGFHALLSDNIIMQHLDTFIDSIKPYII